MRSRGVHGGGPTSSARTSTRAHSELGVYRDVRAPAGAASRPEGGREHGEATPSGPRPQTGAGHQSLAPMFCSVCWGSGEVLTGGCPRADGVHDQYYPCQPRVRRSCMGSLEGRQQQRGKETGLFGRLEGVPS